MRAAHAWMHGASWQKRIFAAMSSPGASAPAGEKACAGTTQPNSTAARGSMLLVKPMPATCTTTAHRTPFVSLGAASVTVLHRPAQRTHRARGPAKAVQEWRGTPPERGPPAHDLVAQRARSRAARPAPPRLPLSLPLPLSQHTERRARVVAATGLPFGKIRLKTRNFGNDQKFW